MDDIPDEAKCIVETKDGPVCGYSEKTDEGICYRFKSIPYAKPPLGKLRFLPPSPVQPWSEVLDCTKDAPLPPTFSVSQNCVTGSEDCLYIELSTPNLKPNKPISVMFWIGGLAYSCIMDQIFDTSLITDQNIVFVRCGYRTGALGFLSINDYAAPGNCGLKDVVMALKWVQRNISFFGGDPQNVTIFGSSSGGAVANFMMLSPMANGLFHKTIIQSACALNNWSLSKNPSATAVELAKKFGIDKSSKTEIIEELRHVALDDLLTGFQNCRFILNDGADDIVDTVFKPCIEVDLEGQASFITKSPLAILKSGRFNRVPCIIGSNNVEGALLQHVIKDFYSNFETYNANVRLLVPKELARTDKLSENIGRQLLKFYLDGETHLREDTMPQFLQIISDYYFSYYVNKTVRLLSETYASSCPVYYYIINYAGEWSVPKQYNFFNSTGHSAELPFLFRIKMPEVCKGSRDSRVTRRRVVKMWTNFAKFGNPTPDEDDPLLSITWDPVENKDRLNYLSIGSELTKGRNPFQARMKFWDDLHKEHAFLRALVYFNDSGYSH